MGITVVVGHLQLLVLDEVKKHMVAYRPAIKGKERRSRAPTFEDARIVGRKHDLYDYAKSSAASISLTYAGH